MFLSPLNSSYCMTLYFNPATMCICTFTICDSLSVCNFLNGDCDDVDGARKRRGKRKRKLGQLTNASMCLSGSAHSLHLRCIWR